MSKLQWMDSGRLGYSGQVVVLLVDLVERQDREPALIRGLQMGVTTVLVPVLNT